MSNSPWIKQFFKIATIFAAAFPGFLYPQVSDISFDHIFLEQGLSQSIVKCMLQDQDGFMYFGTEDGLNIYDAYKFTILRKTEAKNSLSYNDITALCQDRYGRFWIGTFNSGVNLYIPEKKKFIHFNFERKNLNSISNDNINAIASDKDGTIWIGTDQGINRIINSEKETGFTILRGLATTDNQIFLLNERIISVLCDRQGNIWAGTTEGLVKISYTQEEKLFSVVKYKNEIGKPQSLSENTVRAIFEDSRNNLWIGTDYGLNRIQPEERNKVIPFFTHYFTNHNSISHNEIHAICEDASGMIWVGTNGGGINVYDIEKNRFSVYMNDPLDSRSLSINEIRSLYKDRSGIIWVGTYGGGINKVSRGRGQFYHYKHRQNDSNSLSHSIIWSFYQDKDSILWIGTHNGLDRLDRKSNLYKSYRYSPVKNSISSNMVRVITPAEEGKLLIGTNGGGINELDTRTGKFKSWLHNPQDENSLIHNEIRSIFIDKEGDTWVGTYGGGMDKFDRSKGTFKHYYFNAEDSTSLSQNYVRTIIEDKEGYLWIGTEGGGLNKFDKKTEKFVRYRLLQNTPSISSDYIFSIFIDSSGSFWLGTYGGGLNKYNPSSNEFKTYSTDQGLPSNSIYGILQDNNGFLWLSTNNGLSRFDPKAERFKNYNVKDGLQNNEFNGGSYYRTESGELLFGGINGFNAFYPENIKDNNYIPPVVLTSFKIFNREVAFPIPIAMVKDIELSFSDNVFSLEFAALDYSSPEKNLYAYRMEGVDKNWVNVNSSQRLAAYTTLSSGEYIFYVKASNSDGIWNEKGIKIHVSIIPPFWQEPWFILLSIIIILIILFLLYLRRLKIIRMKIELRTAHDAQLSIMPHTDPVHEKLEVSGICIPANEVGGDFFDYFWLDDKHNKFGIMIGDVSGKAMKAAVTAIMTSGMIISEIRSNRCINRILDNVNASLLSKIEKKMFVSACICIIDSEQKVLSVANAGLNRPILVSQDKFQFLYSEGPRLPLGVRSDILYQKKDFQLNSGDLLILTTDGVNEAQDSNRVLFGEERLKKYIMELDYKNLPVSEIKNSIIGAVQTFIHKEKPYDDMTVMVVRIK